MKFNIRKISAIGASVLLAGLTMGTAVAANYPEPFVSGGSANAAIVYGSGTGVSTLDVVEAGHIQTDLDAEVTTGGTVSVDEDESYKFEKTSTKFNLGDTITGVIASALTDDKLPSLLADGKYIDNDNDEIDYTQKITMAASQLVMFEDNDYKEDTPTVGFRITSGSTVLTYQLTFSDALLMSDTPTTDLPIMGKNYYVLSNTSTTMTLLDSAEEAVLSEGETVTIGGKSASIEYISATEVKLNVDGEVTRSLEETNTHKLSDGSYLGIKDIMHDSKQGSISKVEFSLGSGKLKLTDGDIEVQINDETISGLESDFSLSGDTLSNIELAWKADEDLFVTEDTAITMPGFEVVSLSYGGLNYPFEETIEVKQGGDLYAVLEDFPLKDGAADINFLYAAASGAFSGIGKDATNQLLTARSGANMTFNDDNTHDYFVASWSDSNDAESYLMRFNSIRIDGTDNKTDLQYLKGGVWTDAQTGLKDGDTVSIGSVDLTIHTVSKLGSTKTVLFGNSSTNINFHTLYSEEGATVYLPYLSTNTSTAAGAVNFSALYDGGTAGHNATSFELVMKEEDKSENKYAGDWINMTIGWDSSTTAEVEVSSIATSNTDAASTEIQSTDVWRDFAYSELATEILYNKPSSGQKSVKLVYHGDEVTADVYISSSEAVTTIGGDAGVLLVKDTEVSSVATKNLIVVGGSCINSAAAALVGGAHCGPAWTAATGVGSGQFLIKGYASSSITSKLALLVAGYEAADTVNAATHLRTKTVDTSMGGIGTTSTAALTSFA
jgi:hypothetical protein